MKRFEILRLRVVEEAQGFEVGRELSVAFWRLGGEEALEKFH